MLVGHIQMTTDILDYKHGQELQQIVLLPNRKKKEKETQMARWEKQLRKNRSHIKRLWKRGYLLDNIPL